MGGMHCHKNIVNARSALSFLSILLPIIIITAGTAGGNSSADSIVPLIPTDQLRHIGVLTAGDFSALSSGSVFGLTGGLNIPYVDPETGGDILWGCRAPRNTSRWYMLAGSLWVGGVVDGDTLLSQGSVWSTYGIRGTYFKEFWPDNPLTGGFRRTGRFADDEFTTTYTDTVTDMQYVGRSRPFSDTNHIPLGIRICETVYCWHDTASDNFIIVTYEMTNILDRYIQDAWIGFYSWVSVFDSSAWPLWWWYLPNDDFCGILDTVLCADDQGSRVRIAYGFDNDGDPVDNHWGQTSVRGAISYHVLETNIINPVFNFNWWTHDYTGLEFGPRRIGTPDDPFRVFEGGNIGTPEKDEDKYYLMSHHEVDYNMLETANHDSLDGWIPCPSPQNGYLPECLLSFGPFNLGPDDTVTFALAIVLSDELHVNPSDFADYYSVDSPFEFQARLDFGQMMRQHRRADSVYRSGFTLPIPGPPQGLTVVDYEDSFVELAWHPTSLPTLDGYFVYVMDAQSDDTWRRALPNPVGDTACILPIFIPDHRYYFAVSMLDTLGRESRRSMAVSAIPARPHPPRDLTATLDSAVPVLTWSPGSDTALAAFLIYRSEWHGDFELHDSTAAHCYRDTNAGSGIQYRYLVSAKNVYGLESTAAGPVTVLPMAFDRDILFYDLNFDYTPRLDPYHRHYVDRMINSIRVSIPLDYHDIEYGELSLPFMSHYKVIVADMEKRAGYFSASLVENLRVYLEHGGRVFLIAPNVSMLPVPTTNYRRNHFDSGDFFHDKLHLDSSISNAIVFSDAMLYGDLTGCQPASADYPVLEADSEIIGAAPITVYGYLRLSGLIYPRDDVDILYLYQSMYPDSVFHNQINGIRYIGNSGSFILFNFPLSLMKSPGNVVAFRRALTDLGLNLTCGDVTDDGLFNIGDAVYCINFLYRNGPPSPEPPRADIDCDGGLNLEDVVIMINVIFRDGGCLTCCFQDF